MNLESEIISLSPKSRRSLLDPLCSLTLSGSQYVCLSEFQVAMSSWHLGVWDIRCLCQFNLCQSQGSAEAKKIITVALDSGKFSSFDRQSSEIVHSTDRIAFSDLDFSHPHPHLSPSDWMAEFAAERKSQAR